MSGVITRRGLLRGVVSTGAALTVLSAWPQGIVDVGSFGAKFNGIDDDHGAINAALNFARNNGIGRVLMPAGRALIGGTIKIPSGIELRGVGDETKIIARPELNLHTLTNENKDGRDAGISLQDFAIDGNKLLQSPTCECRGVYLFRVSNLFIRGITVQNTVGHGLHVSNAGDSSGSIVRQVVTDCRFSGASSGYLGSSSGLAVTDAQDVKVERVTSTNNDRAGFRISSKGKLELIDCHAELCGDGGFVLVSNSSGISFLRCAARRNGQRSAFDGFRLVGAENMLLTDCVSSENQGAGLMLLNGCRDIAVRGGAFLNNGVNRQSPGPTDGRSGIVIKSSGHENGGIRIERVVSSDRRLEKTQLYGIEISDRAAHDIEVRSCTLAGNKRGPIFNASREPSISIL